MEIHKVVNIKNFIKLSLFSQQNQQLQTFVALMSPDNEPIITNLIKDVMQLVWVGVAREIIAKKLSLKAAHLEAFQFMASYMSNATENKQQYDSKMACDKDPNPIPIDNLAYGQMTKQKRENNASPSRKVSMNESVNQTRSRRFTLESFNKQKSVPDSKNLSPEDNGLLTLPEVEDLHNVKDPQEDSCRNIIFRTEKEQVQMKKMLADRQKQRQESSIRNKKLMKDLKKYTYDFEGNFFATGAGQSNHQKTIKIEKENGQQEIVKKDQKAPEQKSIDNDKLKQRQNKTNRDLSKQDKNVPQFNEKRPQSLLDMFQQDNNLSEGIKLIGQKGNQKIIKEKPRRKLSGMKKYRLNEYQNIIKDQKFKDHKKTSSKLSSTTIDVNKTAPLGSYNPEIKSHQAFQSRGPNLSSNSQLSLTIKKDQTSSILPPINSSHLKKHTKLGLKRLSVGFIESSRSLNQSGIQSHKSKKSQIKIDHEQLYLQNFTLTSHNAYK